MDEEIIGGCEGRYFTNALAAIALVIMVLFVFYMYKGTQDAQSEGMCGGMDQLCGCSGNETFVGGITDNKLSYIGRGN